MYQVIGKRYGRREALFAGMGLLLLLTACGQAEKPSGESVPRETQAEAVFAGNEGTQNAAGSSEIGEASEPVGSGTENGKPGASEEKNPSGESGNLEGKNGALSEEKQEEEMAGSVMRRPVSPEQPMWIVHIDTWNYADPQKIIDLIPEDIRPFVVFNISMSISWNAETHEWQMVQDGYELARSWLRTCADNGVWAMIQPASGGQCHFPDYDSSVDYEDTLYAEFYRDYPNFIGYNYCEQFWGFASTDFPVTPEERYEHFAGLLELSNRYGGYLVVSWCGNQWSPGINPLAMLKKVPSFEEACGAYTENFILCEKYTQTSYLSDMESLVLGAWLSGYCGQFGVRYDESGWTDLEGEGKEDYRLSTSLAVELERFALNGMTVVDGPELIWVSDFRELPPAEGEDGYAERRWETTPEFENVAVDLFRKVLDGTIRIPDREEVIGRTKLIIVNDVKIGTEDERYSSPATLFEGLYRMDEDGNLRDNHSFYKKTGRYPSIPVAYALRDQAAKSFEVQVCQSDLVPRWPPSETGWATVERKQEIFNELFPEEYTGDCYAGRLENTWVIYNPYKEEKTAAGELPCQYNTCERIGLSLTRYTSGIIREYADRLDFYLNNYDEKEGTIRENIIKIYGCTREPAFTWKDRGRGEQECSVVSDWSEGVFTLTIRQNGPLELSVSCAGTAEGRRTEQKRAAVSTPEAPPAYLGPRQYEAEHFDFRDIEELVRNGCQTGVSGFWGQGYLKFGMKAGAAVRDTVHTARGGSFTMKLRYAAGKDTEGLTLYVNGEETAAITLKGTSSYSDWAIWEQTISLEPGENVIELKAVKKLKSPLYLDGFVLEGDFGG